MAGDSAMGASQAAAGTLVAVYAAMMGFFVALNALSVPAPARGDEIVKSIQASFGGGLAVAPSQERTASQDGDAAAARAMAILVDALSAPFSAPDIAGRHELRFAAAALFAPAQARLRADRIAALDRALAMLLVDPAWHVSVLVAAGQPALPARPLTQARVAALASHLLDQGWPEDRLSLVATDAIASDAVLGLRLQEAPLERGP